MLTNKARKLHKNAERDALYSHFMAPNYLSLMPRILCTEFEKWRIKCIADVHSLHSFGARFLHRICLYCVHAREPVVVPSDVLVCVKNLYAIEKDRYARQTSKVTQKTSLEC